MTEYTLREATNQDFELSYKIRKNALGEYVEQTRGWDEDWQLKYHKKDFDAKILKIIEVKGNPAGSLEVYRENDHLVVSGLYIIDRYQNQQIGTRIMTSIIKDAQLNSFKIKLQVLKVNNKAKVLYERLNFKVFEETEHHFQMIYKPSDK